LEAITPELHSSGIEWQSNAHAVLQGNFNITPHKAYTSIGAKGLTHRPEIMTF
jgi:hypothetical protein